MFFTILPSG